MVELCVVKELGNQSLYLLSDEGNILYPSSSLDSVKIKAGQRYRVTYKIMVGDASKQEETVIQVAGMQPVLIKDAVSRVLFSGTINDQVWLVSKPRFGGDYLNFEFSFGYSNTNIKHGIHLVQDSTTHENDVDIIYLTFGHDANGDSFQYKTSQLVSFPLTSIAGIHGTDSLIVTVLEGEAGNPVKTNYRLVTP